MRTNSRSETASSSSSSAWRSAPCRCSTPTKWPANSRVRSSTTRYLRVQDPPGRRISCPPGNNIPFIITDENLEVINSHLIPDKIIDHPDRLRRQIGQVHVRKPAHSRAVPILVGTLPPDLLRKIALLKSLYYFPYIQIIVIAAFITLGFICLPLVEARRAEPRLDRSGPRRPPTSWPLRPPRCSDGSSISARRISTRRPSKR